MRAPPCHDDGRGQFEGPDWSKTFAFSMFSWRGCLSAGRESASVALFGFNHTVTLFFCFVNLIESFQSDVSDRLVHAHAEKKGQRWRHH